MSRIGIMLDIETLSTDQRAYVYEVGAVKFDLTTLEILDKELWRLNGEYQEGRAIDASTLEWMTKVPGRWEAFAKSRAEGVPAICLYSDFLHFIPSEKFEIWTKGNFDIPILESLFRESIQVPSEFDLWKYHNVRDFRTLLKVAIALGVDIPEAAPTHNALEDCELQFDNFVRIMNALSGWNG